MALHPLIAVLLFSVIGSLFSETSAATCRKTSTCKKTLYRTKTYYYTCGSWWSRRTCRGTRQESYQVSEPCYKYEVCEHCQWSDWTSTYGSCSVKCGGGFQTVTQKRSVKKAAYNGGNACTGGSSQKFTQSCNTNPCPVDCKWSEWGTATYNDCPVTCGGGIQMGYQLRSIAIQEKYGGERCTGGERKDVSRSCNPHPCPIDCKWSEWGTATYNDCPVTCGGGIQMGYQLRSVEIQAMYGGEPCIGGERKDVSRSCNPHPCPIDGAWSEYSDFTTWTECSGECDQSRQRDRSCTNPRPQYGGADCDGEAVDVQVRDCYEGQCLVESCKSRKKSYDLHATLPRNCKQYVSCSHTNTVMDCGKGTHWNQEKLTCDHEDVAGCKDDDEPDDESETCVDGEFFTENNDLTVFFRCEHGRNRIQCIVHRVSSSIPKSTHVTGLKMANHVMLWIHKFRLYSL
ncbi:hemicentin-1-like [Pecten maximus]|uniref:hemicentin-1-like n=1 Tax=Pecten maximus TaxID=6579 RepID=UPI00145821BB|nr:hemicentin-1-like [Pecten maximus]